jgi:flagellar FliJ protein
MKKFQFSLERLLAYRKTQAEAAERTFAAVLAQVEKLIFDLKRTEQEREDLARELLEQRLSADTRREVLEGHAYLQRMWLRMVRIRGELKSWREKLDEARAELEEARRELKAVETLKEKSLAEYQVQARREETLDLDEAARNAYLRRVRSEDGADAQA